MNSYAFFFLNNAKELYLNWGHYNMTIISEKGVASFQPCSSTSTFNSAEVNSNSQMPLHAGFPGMNRRSGNLRV